jgi:hypothetical protein
MTANEPGTGEASQWADHPFTGDLPASRARVEAVAEWEGAIKQDTPAKPEVIDAAAAILAAPAERRDASFTVRPVTVWEIEGTRVFIWDAGPPGQPRPTAVCTCWNWDDGPCEHVLVALAGTSLSGPDPKE